MMKKKVARLGLYLMLIFGISGLLQQPVGQSVQASSQKITRRLKMKKIPARYQNQVAPAKRGTVAEISYETTYQQQTYPKRALVYLPAGYTENKTKRYNILYLLHGATMDETSFLGRVGRDQTSTFKKMLDHEIADEKMKPMIVVTPSYYPDSSFMTADYFQDDPLNLAFAKRELTTDLIPAVEGQYHTYAESTSKKDLKAARNHRAFGGFSMGAITAWYVFEHDLSYFKYYLPMAGDSWTITENGGGVEPKATAAKLAKSVMVSSYGPKDYRIFASVGGADGTGSSMAPQIKQMRRHSEQFTETNLFYSIDPDGGHDVTSVVNQSYNAFQQLFKKVSK